MRSSWRATCARRSQGGVTSDWMAIERERGISVTSTVLQFPYRDHVLNLLDTPGHQDFSEDTYRTLAAVDSAVMVLDAAKGVEPQTRRLFEVCRQRGIPIFTFINKMDRPARDPLELLDEIESTLGMAPVPMNWPLGNGLSFRGVYDRRAQGIFFYERTLRNERMSPETFVSLTRVPWAEVLDESDIAVLQADVELLDGLGITFDHDRVLAANQTPVFFGSALTNFGVRQFLDAFIELAPGPQPYLSDSGPIDPAQPGFSGFVFKIQANMNPKHRDSVAFLRVCSGRFERGLTVLHAQSGKSLRLQRSYSLFANERTVIDEAYPGDVLGLPNTGNLAIGDTLSEGRLIRFAPIPRFQPELFAQLRNADLAKQKQFVKGLRQLESEGAVQVLYRLDAMRREPILAAVGQLQFDVVQARLENEYAVRTTLEPLAFSLARWVSGPEELILRLPHRNEVALARDSEDNYVALFSVPFYLEYTAKQFGDLRFEARS